MKYIHLYNDNSYCESSSFKGTPDTIVLTDEQYEQLGKTLEFRDGQLVAKVQEVTYEGTVHCNFSNVS